jgi:GAF domain-containing protein
LQEFLVPVEEISGRLCVADVHEAEASDEGRVRVLDETVELLACQLQRVELVQKAELWKND